MCLTMLGPGAGVFVGVSGLGSVGAVSVVDVRIDDAGSILKFVLPFLMDSLQWRVS